MAVNVSSEESIWIPDTLNDGWQYTQRINESNNCKNLLEFLTLFYKHSSRKEWEERIKDGQLEINNRSIYTNAKITNGDLISWFRPPWVEPAIPTFFETLFDNNDILIINKPSGLPTVPGGGFLKHTLTELLHKKYKGSNNGLIPKPVHRLGRFTSGALILARKKTTRANLSKLFRDNLSKETSFRRIYRALAEKNKSLYVGETIEVKEPISKCFHPLLEEVWNVKKPASKEFKPLRLKIAEKKAFTKLRLIKKNRNADLLEVTIFTGRPHQIRIHLASIGTPLIGDPFYKADGLMSSDSTTGEGGYFLHAHKLINVPINGRMYSFKAPLPKKLKIKDCQRF